MVDDQGAKVKVQVGSSVVSLDVDALILAVIRRCIAILEVIGLKGDLSSVELAALCKFLFAVADIARLEKESKSAFLSAGEAAYLRMCHELLNKTSFRGSGGETLKPTLTFIIFLTGRQTSLGLPRACSSTRALGDRKQTRFPPRPSPQLGHSTSCTASCALRAARPLTPPVSWVAERRLS